MCRSKCLQAEAPIPDWRKTRLITVDPAIWPIYRKFRNDLRPVHEALMVACEQLNLPVKVLSRQHCPLDIWIRDWGFVEGHYFDYAPSYARGLYSPGTIHRARLALTALVGRPFRRVPIVLDGGNLVHNGKVAIVTEKVFRDNPSVQKPEIERSILSLGFESVVFIPVEPYDNVGHADGILRFLRQDRLLVNDYNGAHFNHYKRSLLRCLSRAKLPLQVVPFPWTYTNDKRGEVWSAVGN